MFEADLKRCTWVMDKKLFKLLQAISQSRPGVEDIPREDTVSYRTQFQNGEFMRLILYLPANLVSAVFKTSLKSHQRVLKHFPILWWEGKF